MTPNKLFIDGVWCDASDHSTTPIINPATEETIDVVPVATDEDIDAALDSTQQGWQQWRQVDAWTRSKMLRQIAGIIRDQIDSIASTLTQEQGKPLGEARSEINTAADQFDWYADEARRIYGRTVEGHTRDQRLLVVRQPIGPVAAFVPWNFPALLAARKLAPAIATGCSIVVGTPIDAPRTVLCLAKACADAALPAGVVNMLTGDGKHISHRLINSGIIRKVSLTGSVPVGKEILAQCAQRMIPASMELGGHSPVLVFADADIGRAAEICARAKFRNMGQVCISASRFYVQESILEQFTKRFAEVASSLRIGHGNDSGTEAGPLASKRRLDWTESLVADARDKGANIVCGGKRPKNFAKGFFYEPTVLTNVHDGMDVMNQEPFGPIAPIKSFRDVEDGLAQANRTEFGLAGYVFTNNTKTAFLVSEGLEVGMVGVNNLGIASAEVPFGGIKSSGFGREGGSEGIESYTNVKYININL